MEFKVAEQVVAPEVTTSGDKPKYVKHPEGSYTFEITKFKPQKTSKGDGALTISAKSDCSDVINGKDSWSISYYMNICNSAPKTRKGARNALGKILSASGLDASFTEEDFSDLNNFTDQLTENFEGRKFIAEVAYNQQGFLNLKNVRSA